MKRTLTNRVLPLLLAVVMLVLPCMAGGSLFASQASAAVTESQYTLDMTATINAQDSTIIDVVITAKNFKQELLSSEFCLNFDSSKVAGVLTTYEEMDAFMTKTPTYIFSYSGVEAPLPSFEQICYYNLPSSRYECRFIDLLEYPYAKAGQTIKGLMNDGDLVVTVQFKILEDVAPGTEIEFSLTEVRGTTNHADGLNSVPGTGDTASVTVPTNTSANASYALDVTASVNAEDSSIIDVVITAKDFKQELVTSEFHLNFDSTKVEGVVTDSEDMDAFMTKIPTYIFSYAGVEATVPSFEQICYYNVENSRYDCRFCDLLDYPYAKAGQTIKGLQKDGDMVVTIPFKIRDGVTPGTQIQFSVTNVKGTTNLADGLNGVTGTGDSVTFTVPAAPAVDKFDIAFSQIDMGNTLGMRFAFPAVAGVDFTGAYAKATMAGSTVTIPATQWTTANIGGTTHYIFGYSNIAAKQMADEISIVIYNKNGVAISNTYVDSIQAYVMRNVDKKDAESKTLMVDMLNYGAAAQVYYGYNASDLANAQLTDAQKAYATETMTEITDIRVRGANYLGTRLELGSRLSMQMNFKNTTADMYAVIEFTNHSGSKVSERVAPTLIDGSYLIIIDQIAVADGRVPVTVTVYYSDGVVYGSATDSMASYIARMTNSDALYESIMKFSDSAYAYLH